MNRDIISNLIKSSSPRLKLVVLAALAITTFHFVTISASPPVEGDSYEYASLARSLLENGGLLENHVWFHLAGIKELPAPSDYRAGLYPFLLAPFYLIFGKSHFTFTAPGLLALLLLPIISFLIIRKLTKNESAALFVSIMIIFQPRIIFTHFFQEAGRPDLLLGIFWITAVGAFLKNRFAFAGFLAGIGALLKFNGIIVPASFFFYAIIFDRAAFRRRGTYIALGLFALVLSPLIIRNIITLGSPSHLTNYAWHLHPLLQTVGGKSWMPILFDPFAAGKTAAAIPRTDHLLIALYNLKAVFVGIQSIFEYEHGLYHMLGLLGFALFIIGVFSGFRKTDFGRLMLLQFALLGSAYVFGNALFGSRHLFPLLPAIYLFVYFGAEKLGELLGQKYFSARAALIFMLAVGGLPALIMQAGMSVGPARSAGYKELRIIGDYLDNSTPPDTRIISLPFQSPEFFANRGTISLPWGSAEAIEKLRDDYRADYLLFYGFENSPAPGFPFLEEVIKGRRVTLFKFVDPFLSGESAGGEFNPLANTIGGPARFDWSPALATTTYAAFGPVGLLIFTALMIGAMAALGRFSTGRSAALVVVILMLSATVVRAYYLVRFAPVDREETAAGFPLFNQPQAEQYFSRISYPTSATLTVSPRFFENDQEKSTVEKLAGIGGFAINQSNETSCPSIGPAFCLAPLPAKGDDLNLIELGAAENFKRITQAAQKRAEAAMEMKRLGYRVERIGATSIGYLADRKTIGNGK